MRLHDVANRFNKMVCTDGYSGADLFRAQLGLYDDNKRDSETAERRVLSVSPNVTIPTRRVIGAAGSRWIVGHANPDDYKGSTIRVGYVCHEATHLATVRTLAEVVAGSAGTTAYAGRAWVKDAAYTQQSSDLAPLYHIHFSSTETIVPERHIITFAGRLHIVRSVVAGSGGTLVALCEQMSASAVETGTVSVGTYVAATDTRTETPTSKTIVRFRWQSLFAYLNGAAPKFEPGDIQVAIATSVTPAAGTILTLADGSWRIHSVVAEQGVWLCRATRYA